MAPDENGVLSDGGAALSDEEMAVEGGGEGGTGEGSSHVTPGTTPPGSPLLEELDEVTS